MQKTQLADHTVAQCFPNCVCQTVSTFMGLAERLISCTEYLAGLGAYLWRFVFGRKLCATVEMADNHSKTHLDRFVLLVQDITIPSVVFGLVYTMS